MRPERAIIPNINFITGFITGMVKKEDGLTIVEVIIAISILAIGILAVGTMQVSAIKVNSIAMQLTERTTWIQDRFERLIALSYNDPWLEPAGNPPGMDSAGNTHQVMTADNHTVSWNVTDDNPVPNTKLIVVTVTKGTKSTNLSYTKSQF